MNRQEQPDGDAGERLSREVREALGRSGWRVPQSDAEVRAAEEWVARSNERLPEQLQSIPDPERRPAPGRLLDRYLKSDGPDRSPDASKSMGEDRPVKDVERD